mmetsp:Transcript_50506/g.99767  ORF Transcript_50506/g.99767 Transcript_50506/m.99767 type:complete len:628 (+) Transcript_50506:105-1988(+)
MSSDKVKTSYVDTERIREVLSSSMLQEMVNELEETKLKLLVNIKDLKEKLVQQNADQADIYFYLNKKCDECFEVIASLEEQIINEQTDREIAEKMYENKIEEMKSAQVFMESRYVSKLSELETRLEMLNSFSEEKEESERNLENLMIKLDEERQQFCINTESVENRFLLERDKLRKTYDQKYEKIKKELEASVEGKMSNKTKKTQIMNVMMKKEMDNQSEHAEKLLLINQQLAERDKSRKLELDVISSLNKDMAIRLAVSQRTIKQLNKKISAMEAAGVLTQDLHATQLREKADELAKLEGLQKRVQNRTLSENRNIDKVWTFLANSFSLVSTDNHQSANLSSSKTKMSASAMFTEDNAGIHEKLLVSLVKEVVRKFPHILGEVDTSRPVDHLDNGEVKREKHRENSSPLGTMACLDGKSQSSSHFFSPLSGIPSWDINLANQEKRSCRRSISVQTDNIFPLHSSHSQSNNVGFQPSLLSCMEKTSETVNIQSGQALVFLSSSSDEYSVKTASHVLQVPTHRREKPSKSLSSLRGRRAGCNPPYNGVERAVGETNHSPTTLGNVSHQIIPPTIALEKMCCLTESKIPQPIKLPYANSRSKIKQHTFSPLISVSGQGIASPLVLPKLL